ncbi:DUF1206 domain-containing protein [Propionibacteriaceae bacterium G1746]
MSVEQGVRRASNHPVVTYGARVGYAASGVLHLLLGWLALRLAWGSYGGEADQAGAFETLRGSGAGLVLLIVLAIGFVLLGVWNLIEAALTREGAGTRVKHVAKGLTYAAMTFGALSVVAGNDESSAGQSRDVTARLLSSGAGVAVVVVIGVVVLGVGGYHVYKGFAKKYHDDLREHPGSVVEVLATVGYVAKGVALVVVGGLFVAAALTHDPQKASGMDGALRTLMGVPWGQALVTLVAVGLVAYGLYSFARAKYARV